MFKKLEEKNQRKNELEAKKTDSKIKSLIKAIEVRKIPVEKEGEEEEVVEYLKNALEKPVLEEQELLWPVFFLYPEHSTSDYIERFSENAT